jgi:hypothetical protein
VYIRDSEIEKIEKTQEIKGEYVASENNSNSGTLKP